MIIITQVNNLQQAKRRVEKLTGVKPGWGRTLHDLMQGDYWFMRVGTWTARVYGDGGVRLLVNGRCGYYLSEWKGKFRGICTGGIISREEVTAMLNAEPPDIYRRCLSRSRYKLKKYVSPKEYSTPGTPIAGVLRESRTKPRIVKG